MPDTQRRVCIETRSGERGVSLIALLSDGGFSLVVPYHPSGEGILERNLRGKHPRLGRFIPHPPLEDRFTASDRVKLSFHYDGFTQFSSEKGGRILSGRDKAGQPKGLGILREPFSRIPIQPKLLFILTLWGLDHFAAAKRKPGTITFTHKDVDKSPFVQTQLQAIRPVEPGLALFGSIIPLHLVRSFEEQMMSLFVSDKKTKIKFVKLRNELVALGIGLKRVHVSFPSASGYNVDTCPSPDGEILQALYPRPSFAEAGGSLDYKPPS